MSVKVVNGIGCHVFCKWCNHPLITSSKTEYRKCDNCGGLHGINEPEPIVFKPVYNWYYIKRLLFSWL